MSNPLAHRSHLFPWLAIVLAATLLSGCGFWKSKPKLAEVVATEREPVRRESNAEYWRCDQKHEGVWACHPRQRPQPAPGRVQEPPAAPEKAAGSEPKSTLDSDAPIDLDAAATKPEPETPSGNPPATERLPDVSLQPGGDEGVDESADFVATPGPELENIDAPSDIGGGGLVNTLQAGDYVVQVGAFRRQQGAAEAAASIRGVDVEILIASDGGGDWYLLVIGAWSALDGAEAAAAQFLDANPQGDTWIRRGSAILQSLSPDR